LPYAGYSADQAGLLAMMNAFTNWKWYQSRAECNDWSDRPGAMYCNWDGVTCNSAGKVVEVKFLKNGSYLTGTSLIPFSRHLYLGACVQADHTPSVIKAVYKEHNAKPVQGMQPLQH
jgi:hypothetical protein